MKKTISILLLSLAGVMSAWVSALWAGQIVTGETKAWAREAVRQEASVSAKPGGNTVAVLYFKNSSGSAKLDPIQKGMAFMLMTDLAKVENLQLVERAKLQALVEELGMGTSGIVDEKTAPRVGKLLQARYLVGGNIMKAEKADLKLDSEVLSVQKSETLGSPKAEGMLAELFAVEKKLLFQIIDILKVKITPEKREELKEPMSTNTAALLNLFAAIDSSDRGDYRTAEGYYKKALENDSKLAPARQALSELKALGLVTAPKRTKALTEDLQERTSRTSTLIPDIVDLRDGDPGDIQKRESVSGRIRVQW